MTFSLPRLFYKAHEPTHIDEYEYTLATSPALSSIRLIPNAYNAHGNVEYNKETALQLATGLAPNLTRVHITYQSLKHSTLRDSPLFLDTVHQG